MYFTQVKDSTRSAAIALLIALAATRIAIAFAHPYSLADNGIYQDDAFYFLQIARSWPPCFCWPLGLLRLARLHSHWVVGLRGLARALPPSESLPLRRTSLFTVGMVKPQVWECSLLSLLLGYTCGSSKMVCSEAEVESWVTACLRGLQCLLVWIWPSWLRRWASMSSCDCETGTKRWFGVALCCWPRLRRFRCGCRGPPTANTTVDHSCHYRVPLVARLRSTSGGTRWTTYGPTLNPRRCSIPSILLGATALMELPLLSPLRFGVPFFPWTGVRPYPPHRFYLQHPGIVTIAAAVSLAGLVYLLLRRRTRQGLGLALLLYSVLMTFGYGVAVPVHWFYARYLAPILLLTSVVGVSAVARLLEPLPSRRRHALAALVLIVTMAGPLRDLGFFGRLSFAAEAPPSPIPAALERIQSRLPPGAHLGMFQAGAVSWFSGGGVMNLDGKVNNAAYEALADGRLHEYILASGVTHIHAWEFVLERLSLRHVPQANWHLERIDPGANSYDPTLFRITTP
jgi:hypothetical protein